MVGLPGFEPGTSCTPSKRASQAALQPDFLCRTFLFYQRPSGKVSFGELSMPANA